MGLIVMTVVRINKILQEMNALAARSCYGKFYLARDADSRRTGNSEVIRQIPVSYPILPIRPDERDQGTSFDGSVPQSWGAVLSNEDPRRY